MKHEVSTKLIISKCIAQALIALAIVTAAFFVFFFITKYSLILGFIWAAVAACSMFNGMLRQSFFQKAVSSVAFVTMIAYFLIAYQKVESNLLFVIMFTIGALLSILDVMFSRKQKK